jgi:predicted transcriptional regulator
VSIKRSVQPDHIVCLDDGKKFKSLKRHLMSHYNMTPEEYREKWGLPHDYPMVAPKYAQTRSELAKKGGLGRRKAAVEVTPQPKVTATASALTQTEDSQAAQFVRFCGSGPNRQHHHRL